jgi:hypothetical protein
MEAAFKQRLLQNEKASCALFEPVAHRERPSSVSAQQIGLQRTLRLCSDCYVLCLMDGTGR